MRCARVQDRLLLYLAGELEPREEEALRRHVESCSHCSAVAAELAETQELVASALRTTVTAPASLHARVMAAGGGSGDSTGASRSHQMRQRRAAAARSRSKERER